jgi:PEP-CTERM motif-containing protein
MRRHYRYVALAATAFAATLAIAAPSSGGNPLARRTDGGSFFGSGAFADPPLDTRSGIGRPVGRYGPVTPVPEPSEWLMMAAGIGLVGVILRRGTRRR